jgi:hypothetical protein
MATSAYISGRKKYSRPQGILLSENPGTIQNGIYVPIGYEVGQSIPPEDENNTDLYNQFLVLSDHNRAPIDFSIQRLEKRERMINGRMRSYHIADKLQISTSWNRLPSRSFGSNANFDQFGKYSQDAFTADGGASGAQLLEWYENHTGSFWAFLAYDKYTSFEDNQYNRLNQYNEIVEVFISDFSYSVEKRGANNHDLWNVSLKLEEV